MTTSPLIDLAHVSYTYPNGRPALHDVSLQVWPGERVALLGANGAGKSTLLLQLNGILQPGAGTVKVAGLPLNHDNLPAIRTQVGLLFQNPEDQTFSPTVLDDVAFGVLQMGLSSAVVGLRVDTALADAGIPHLRDRATTALSLGELKRVALAGVLVMQPDILVLDEPLSGLDPRGRQQLINLLGTLPQTVLASTHDLAFATTFFDRLVLMDAGRIVATGPVAAMRAAAYTLFGLTPV